MLLQGAQPIHDLSCIGIAHHAAANFRIRYMHGNVQRTDTAAQDAIEFFIIDVGQGDEIAHHQGKTPVVILHIQGIPHTRRHLVNKAKNTVIVTRARLGNNGLIQGDPQRLPVFLLNMEHVPHAIFMQNLQGQPLP